MISIEASSTNFINLPFPCLTIPLNTTAFVLRSSNVLTNLYPFFYFISIVSTNSLYSSDSGMIVKSTLIANFSFFNSYLISNPPFSLVVVSYISPKILAFILLLTKTSYESRSFTVPSITRNYLLAKTIFHSFVFNASNSSSFPLNYLDTVFSRYPSEDTIS